MSIDVQVLQHLAKSLLSTSLLVVCSSYTLTEMNTVAGAVQWSSIVTLLGAAYYLQAHLWARLWLRRRAVMRSRMRGFDEFRRHRSQYEMTETASLNGFDCDGSMTNVSSTNASLSNVSLHERRSYSPTEVDPSPPLMEDDLARSQTVYYPELTMGSVWTYVYGWGLLLFVCVYCMAAIDVPASCWWTMGMIALSFDELIAKGVKNCWVVVLGVCLAVAVFSLWSGVLMDKDGNMLSDAMFSSKSPVLFLNFIMGVAYPVAVPFIFFTVRSTARTLTQDVGRLCEFAMPFMVVLSICSLVATSGACGYGAVSKDSAKESLITTFNDGGQKAGRRLLGDENATIVMLETVAKFASSYASNIDKNASIMQMMRANHTLNYTLLFLSPFAALWLLRVLIIAVLTGHTTEFITSFLLVVSTRHGATHDFNAWSAAAAGSAGVAFVLLLMVRRE